MKHVLVYLLFLLFFMFHNLASAQVYQLSNPGFEIWDGNGPDDEPTNWNGFPSASCNLVVGCGSATATRHEKSTDKRPGSSGNFSCKIFATEVNILGNTIVANGTITTGQIRIGSTTASSNQNYNITRTANSLFRQPLNAKPDSISFWAKFVCPSSIQQARMSAVIHGNYDYRDPDSSDPNAAQYVVGKAIHNFTRGNQGWIKYTVPFDYNFPHSTPAYILLTFTTNKIAGEGSSSDVLYIDDIELIYNPRLSSLNVNGVSVPGFHPDVLNYYLSVPCFSSQIVSATAASPNATMQISQPTFTNPVAVVTVTAGNVSREYKVHFVYASVHEYNASVCQGNIYSDQWFSLPVQQTTGVFQYQSTIVSVPGCDSIVKLNLTVHPSFFPDTIHAMICENGSYNFYGNQLSVAGIYDTLFYTVHGCDSLVVLDLEVGDYYLFTIFAAICQGETYTQNGFNQSVAGLDTLYFVAQDGCDSLMVLNLTVNPIYNISIYDTISQGSSYNNYGFSLPVFNSYGNFEYILHLNTVNGCDSLVRLFLYVQEVVEDPKDEDPEFGVVVFPNPAEDSFTIEIITNSSAKFVYDMFDTHGQLMRFGEICDKTAVVYVQNLSKGIYLIRVISSSGDSKIVKVVLL